jgi:hypothetical protein
MLESRYKTFIKDNKAILSAVILLIAFGMGVAVRVQYLSNSIYPINDGGLFYQMVEDLLNNGLRIPKYSTYNNDLIPFAYPPLAFYIVALIKLASGQSLLQLFRVIPLLVSILIIFAFYLFVKKLFNNEVKTALSVLIFALLPRTYQWFIMGGGVTRGFGFLFAILAIACIWDLFSQKLNWMNLAGVILFSSACVLSHPETSLFLVFMAGVLLIYHRFGWMNLRNGLIVVAGVIVCILPWIISIVGHHGLDPFLGAAGTGHGEWFEIKNFLTLKFGFENPLFLSIVSVFGLIALFLNRDRLTYILSAGILIGYFLFPRSGPNLLTLLVSPLAAMGFYKIITLSGSKEGQETSFYEAMESSFKSKVILIFVVVYLSIGAFSFKYIVDRERLILTDDLLEVYSWLDENIDQDDHIMFYPAAGAGRYWWNDFAAEWFPALTSKANLTTVQGYEWVAGEYQKRVDEYVELRTCSETGPVCVADWESRNAIRVNYLVIGQITARQDFLENFIQHENYRIAYTGEDYLVLAKE